MLNPLFVFFGEFPVLYRHPRNAVTVSDSRGSRGLFPIWVSGISGVNHDLRLNGTNPLPATL